MTDVRRCENIQSAHAAINEYRKQLSIKRRVGKMRKCLWSDGFEAVMAAMQEAGPLTHTVTVTNHKVGTRRFEARFAFRDTAGRILSAGHIERTTRYMQIGFEEQILDIIQRHAKLGPGQIRIAGEPEESDSPTYPRFWKDDAPDFETEFLRKPVQQ